MGEGPEHNPFAPPAEYADFALQPVAYEHWHLATYWQRFAGAFIDNLFVFLTMIPGVMVVGAMGGFDDDSATVWAPLVLLVGPLVLLSYQWTMTAKTGQSIAKRMLGTRIVRDGLGTPPGFVHGVLLRSWLFVLAGMMPGFGSCIGLIDAIAIFFGERNQTLHDRVAQTIVIRE